MGKKHAKERKVGAGMLPQHRKTKITLADGGIMPAVTLGDGPTPVVTIPGAGDGLSTVYDSARNLAWFYRRRARHQRMYLLSRREGFSAAHGIAEHADDYIEALETLRLGPVILECNSAGGPIGQQIAARRPDLVGALVLASTAHRLDANAAAVIEGWLKMVTESRWGDFGWDTTVKTYRAASRLAMVGAVLKPMFGSIIRPSDPQRIANLLRGLLGFDNSGTLEQINCPTLVFGGTRDPIFTPELQHQMAESITDCRFVQATGHLHGADLESDQYPPEVVDLIMRANVQ